MEFKKEFLQEVVAENSDEAELVLDEVTGTSRWTIDYYAIFKFEDRFYATSYSRGATEMQDERPYEYDSDMIECPEVVPTEKTVTVYVLKG